MSDEHAAVREPDATPTRREGALEQRRAEAASVVRALAERAAELLEKGEVLAAYEAGQMLSRLIWQRLSEELSAEAVRSAP